MANLISGAAAAKTGRRRPRPPLRRPPRSTLTWPELAALLAAAAAALAAARLERWPPAAEAVCPQPHLIKPCTCDDEGLQCLSLNSSGLERVFQAPAQPKAIRRAWIFQTNLTELKSNAFGDYIIRDLYLDLNQIVRVEAGALGAAAQTLQSLSLTRNLLTSFPFEDLRSTKRLKQLGLGHNMLTTIQAQAFPPSDKLESLDLSHNKISTVESEAFAELHSLSLLDLSRNQLKTVGPRALLVKSTNRELAISLRANQISELASDAFGDHHPHVIDLSRNRLTYLDEATFSPLILNNTLIDFDGNLFSCFGCEQYRWLVNLGRDYWDYISNFACIDDSKLEDLTLESIGCTNG